jgi:hypothetical protein
MNDLTPVEFATLHAYETIIAKGMTAFLEVGGALARIRDGRLYRATHDTFEAYCTEKWSLSKSHIYRLIAAAEVAENVKSASPTGDEPENENQVRALAELDPDEQAEAWAEAVETAPRDSAGNPKITGKHVAKVVAKRLSEPAELEGPGNACDIPADHGTIETDDGVEWNREPATPEWYPAALRHSSAAFDLVHKHAPEHSRHVAAALNALELFDSHMAKVKGEL